ncbi:MAG: glycosyltransferase [Lachnospiraceae bacterium]|nr:glycosyltransferase [Lachnospiraceae bacterium]
MNRVSDYIKRNGMKKTFYAVRQHLSDGKVDRDYNREMKAALKEGEEDDAAKARQSGSCLPHKPLISILVPTYKPEDQYFREMLRSVKAQTYPYYELLLGVGGGISENTNAALSEAKGDYIALLDQDDLIEPDALYRIALEANMGAALIYSDEDKYDGKKGRYSRPFRKPDFDIELLLSNNYVCHFLAVKRELALKVGGFRSEYDGAQDHDFILRCAEEISPDQISHIRRVLYHWRIHKGSTAGDPAEKTYAHSAGKRAIEDYLKRNGQMALVSETEHRGFYRVEYFTDLVEESAYKMHLGEGIRPLSPGNEGRMRAYLDANPDVGAIGGRVIDHMGRVLSAGYERNEDREIVPLYRGMNYRLSGEFHMAALRRKVDIISNQCVLIRSSLEDCMSSDSGRMCRKIQDRGYSVVIDPQMIFVKK